MSFIRQNNEYIIHVHTYPCTIEGSYVLWCNFEMNSFQLFTHMHTYVYISIRFVIVKKNSEVNIHMSLLEQ